MKNVYDIPGTIKLDKYVDNSRYNTPNRYMSRDVPGTININQHLTPINRNRNVNIPGTIDLQRFEQHNDLKTPSTSHTNAEVPPAHNFRNTTPIITTKHQQKLI